MAGEWEVLTLREAGVTLTDCDHRTPPAAEVGYPYVAIPQLRSGRIEFKDARRISPAHFAEWTRKARPAADDVVLSRRCNPGETAFVAPGSEFALGQNLVLLRADGTRVHPPFLRWLTRGPQWWEQIGKFINVGAVFDSLKCADVPKFELTVPPLAEQRAIAHILGTLDDKIELNRRRNQTLEAMARALFKDWFVDFGPARAKMEGREAYLPADLWQLFPDRLDDEGKPEGWEKKRVSDFLSLSYGKSLPAGKRHLGRIPVYGSGGITGFHSEALVNDPVVIVGRKGTVGSLYWEDRPCFPIDTVFYVQPVAPLPFCYYLLESLPLRDMNTDAAVPGLNRENVYRLDVTAPQAKLISTFAEIASRFRESIAAISNDSETLAQLRDTLLPKLISGELRIADAEKFIERVT